MILDPIHRFPTFELRRLSFSIRSLVWPLALAAAAVTCSSDDLTLPSEGLPAAMSLMGGSGQTAVVATTLPDSLIVRVIDSKSRPVEGIKVAFSPILGGGDAVPDTGLTDADGRTGTRWTLGGTAGTQRLQARVAGPTAGGAPTQNFDAIALAAPADTVFAVRGDGQSEEVGAPLVDSLVVKITDRYGNAVSGGAVTWAPTGGGTVSPASSTTGVGGTAATQRTLGPTAGPQGATAAAAGLKGSPVVFSLTALPASNASKLILLTQPPSTVASGAVLSPAPVVQLQDGKGNPVPTAGLAITVGIASGPAGGVLGGSTTAVTDAAGKATFNGLTISGTVGGYALRFSRASLTGVTSNAINLTAGAPSQLAVTAQPTTAQSGIAFTTAPVVQVQDAAGNPVGGANRSISVSSNTGTAALSGTTTRQTEADGRAIFDGLTLTGVVGPNSLLFSTAGLVSDTTSTITLTAGPATALALTAVPSSGVSGVPLAPQPVVRLVDASGNTVQATGTVITAALASGPGSLGGSLTATTSAGVATFGNLSISGPPGSYTLEFTSGALSPLSTPVITLGTGDAAKLVMVLQPSTTATNAVPFVQQPAVQVQDAAGNPVAGVVAVTAAIASGGGALGGTVTIDTDATGLATFGGLSITGTVGARTLRFASTGLTSAVSQSITVTAGAPSQMAVNAGGGQEAVVGTAVATAPSVVVRDVSGNPVEGVSITFAVASGGGSVLPLEAVATNASGVAAADSWTLGATAGANTLTATAAPDGISPNPVTFTATGVAAGATQIAANSVTTQGGTAGLPVAAPPSVVVRDAGGNPVTGQAVTFAVTEGGGSIQPATPVVTNASGIAALTSWTLAGTPGANTVTATVTGLTGSPVVFSATGETGAATQIAANSATSQTDTAGMPVVVPPSVLVRDAGNNPVEGVAVTFAVTGGGGAILPAAPVLTDASGVATLTSWTLGATAGPNTVTAEVTGLAGSPVTFTATGVAGAPTMLDFLQQPSTEEEGKSITPQIKVRVLDGAGNLVTSPNFLVTMAIGDNPGGSTLSGDNTRATSGGIATFGGLSLNHAGVGYTLVATAPGLASVTSAPFTITPN